MAAAGRETKETTADSAMPLFATEKNPMEDSRMLKKAATLTLALLVLAAVGVWSGARAEEQADKIVRLLRTTNKAQVNSYVPKVYDLQHVNPYAVVRWITRTVQPEEGSFYSFCNPDGNSGKILVICPAHQLEGFDQLIQEVDRPNLTSQDGEKRAYVKLKNRSVADPAFLDTLKSYGAEGSFLLRTDPQVNALVLEDTPSGMATVLAALDESIDVPTKEVAADVTIYEVDVNNDGSLGLDFHAWKNGPGRNLFALGAFTQYESLSDVHVSSDDASYNLAQNQPMFDSGAGTLGLPGNRMSARGANFAYFYHVPSAYFDALSVKGKARVVQKTRLAVLNNRQGSISAGEQILFYGSQTPESVQLGLAQYLPEGGGLLGALVNTENLTTMPAPGGAPYGGYRGNLPLDPYGDSVFYPDNRTVVAAAKDATVPGKTISGQMYDRATGQVVKINNQIRAAESGVFLDLVPKIGEDRMTLDVMYSVVTLTGYDDSGVPQLASRSDSATVQAKDGQEIVLGSQVREAKIKTTRKVPMLGSLPVLGYWFGGEITSAKKNMVVVVMKPTIVKNFNNLAQEDNDLLAKVKGESPAPLPKDEYGWDMYLMGREARQPQQ